jgi:hypothetical protein
MRQPPRSARTRWIAALVLAVAPIACGMNPAPPGSTPLVLHTGGLSFGQTCALVGVPPLLIGRDGDAMTFTEAGGAAIERDDIVWPGGFSAWLVDGTGTLYDRFGAVLGREGTVIADLGGTPDSGRFYVCTVGDDNY